jgi:transcriptional regulator with XRE-family HTH domain
MDMKELRQKKGIRAQDVARILNVGVSTVNSWEQGRATPRFEQIRPLMNLYDVDFDELESAIKESKK